MKPEETAISPGVHMRKEWGGQEQFASFSGARLEKRAAALGESAWIQSASGQKPTLDFWRFAIMINIHEFAFFGLQGGEDGDQSGDTGDRAGAGSAAHGNGVDLSLIHIF